MQARASQVMRGQPCEGSMYGEGRSYQVDLGELCEGRREGEGRHLRD